MRFGILCELCANCCSKDDQIQSSRNCCKRALPQSKISREIQNIRSLIRCRRWLIPPVLTASIYLPNQGFGRQLVSTVKLSFRQFDLPINQRTTSRIQCCNSLQTVCYFSTSNYGVAEYLLYRTTTGWVSSRLQHPRGVEINVSLSFTRVGIGTLANARGL